MGRGGKDAGVALIGGDTVTDLEAAEGIVDVDGGLLEMTGGASDVFGFGRATAVYI